MHQSVGGLVYQADQQIKEEDIALPIAA